MDSRERLWRCYCHEEMDRPGICVRTLYPPGDPSYDRLKAYLQAHSDLRIGFNGTRFETPPPATVTMEPHSEDWQRQVTVLHTPGGDLRSTRLASLRGQPGMDETHLISCRQDAEKYLSLPLPAIAGDVSDFFAKDRAIGPRGRADVHLGSNPGGWVAGLCGSESFALMSVTDRDVLHALCEREMRIVLARTKFLLERGVGPLFALSGQELVSPPLHSPRDFRDFNVKYDKPIIDLIHEAGGRVHVHCHGSIKKVIPGFLEEGADVIHPFEAPPTGDITAAECKAACRGRISLEGNIQIAAMYEHTPEQIREETLALIRDAFDDRRGLIVCPSASPYIRGKGIESFPNFQAMIDTVVQWRG